MAVKTGKTDTAPVNYDAIANKARSNVDYDAIASRVKAAPVQTLMSKVFDPIAAGGIAVSNFDPLAHGAKPVEGGSWMDSAIQFGKSYFKSANPVPVDLLKSIYQRGNIATLKDMGQVQGEQFNKAKESFNKGDYANASRYTLGWLIPLIGPAANAAGDKLEQGKYAEGAGETLGLATQVVLPKAISKVSAVKTPPVLKSRLNPTETATVAFGEREGIPIDAATRTGNDFVRGTQNMLSKQPGAAGVMREARQAQTDALAATGERLKNRVEPGLGTSDYTAETAGQTVRNTTQSRMARFDTNADKAYGQLRQIEAANQQSVQVGTQQQPIMQGNTHMGYQQVPLMKTVGMPVDMVPVKTALKPIYDQMMQRMPVAIQRSSPGLKAIENILNGDDVVSASTADANLSAIKSISRGAESPILRNVSQGLAAKAVSELDTAVRDAVTSAGPDAIKALERGRALTKAKYTAADVLKDLRDEPVQVFNQLTFRKDSSVNLLRDVAKQAPQDMPKLGRAYLEGLFDTATKEGGFGKAGTIYNKWADLGPESKKLMFKNPILVQDLDNFFRLAKRIAENPNPSGTASTAASLAAGGLIVTNPAIGVSYVIGTNALARILMTPKSRVLVRGLQVPIGNGAAATLTASEILKLAGDDARPLAEAAR